MEWIQSSSPEGPMQHSGLDRAQGALASSLPRSSIMDLGAPHTIPFPTQPSPSPSTQARSLTTNTATSADAKPPDHLAQMDQSIARLPDRPPTIAQNLHRHHVHTKYPPATADDKTEHHRRRRRHLHERRARNQTELTHPARTTMDALTDGLGALSIAGQKKHPELARRRLRRPMPPPPRLSRAKGRRERSAAGRKGERMDVDGEERGKEWSLPCEDAWEMIEEEEE